MHKEQAAHDSSTAFAVGPTQVRFLVSVPATRSDGALILLPDQLRDGAHRQENPVRIDA